MIHFFIEKPGHPFFFEIYLAYLGFNALFCMVLIDKSIVVVSEVGWFFL